MCIDFEILEKKNKKIMKNILTSKFFIFLFFLVILNKIIILFQILL